MAKMIESMEQLLRGDAPRASLWDIAGAAVVLLEPDAVVEGKPRFETASVIHRYPPDTHGRLFRKRFGPVDGCG
jgi:hypothetical protein